jgi:DNA-binding response OmpR family regulator
MGRPESAVATMKELVIRRRDESPRRLALEEESVSLGRALECDVVLDSPFVSRRHASLRRAGNAYEIADEGSMNGTIVQGDRIEGTRMLRDGDAITIADFELTYFDHDEQEATQFFAPDVIEGLHVDLERREVWFGAQKLEVVLSPQEFALLSLLYENDGRVCSHQEIGQAVWGGENAGNPPAYDDNMIHRLVYRLKAKVEPAPNEPRYILNVPGSGYRLERNGR